MPEWLLTRAIRPSCALIRIMLARLSGEGWLSRFNEVGIRITNFFGKALNRYITTKPSVASVIHPLKLLADYLVIYDL